jgi:hypothetical protein
MVAPLRGQLSAAGVFGASPSGKAADFDSAIRRFESSRPSQPYYPFTPMAERARKSASRRDLARYPASVGSTAPQQTAPLGAFARPVWAACFGISGFVSCGSCGRGSCAAVPGLPSRFVNDDTRTAAGLLLRAARGRPASRLCLIAFRVQGLDVTRRRAFFPARPNRGAACVRATRRSDRPERCRWRWRQ